MSLFHRLKVLLLTTKIYLKDIAYTKLKKMIINGDIKGPIISENELVEKLKMSRTPIREALQRLQNDDNFLEISPKRGIYIKEITIKEAKDLMEVRLAIELYAMTRIGDQFQEKHLEILIDNIKQQEEMGYSGNIYEFIQLDLEFHKVFLEIFDNEYFVKVLNNISDRISHLGIKYFKKDMARVTASIEDHKVIVEHIKNDEFDKAIATMEEHIIRGKLLYLS